MIDSSASNADEQREAVLQVLRDIGVSQAKLDTCMVEAWNKVICDRLSCHFHRRMSYELFDFAWRCVWENSLRRNMGLERAQYVSLHVHLCCQFFLCAYF